jgi:hypothetical protein
VALARPRVDRLRRDRRADGLPGEHLLEREGAVDARESGAVRQHVAQRDRLLPGRGELRPPARDGLVEREDAALDERVDDDGGHALRRREHEARGVALPRAARLAIGEPAPQIDDRLAVAIDAHGRADLAPRREVRGERIAHDLEAGATVPAIAGVMRKA